MVIRRQNFVATMDFCVATMIKKLLKKNVVILFTLPRQITRKEICRDVFKVCRDIEFKFSNIGQQDYVATQKMSVATTTTGNYEKLCCDKG